MASATEKTTPIMVSVASRAYSSSAHTSTAPKNNIAAAPNSGWMWSASATPIPGNATRDSGSAARGMPRIIAKQPTRPAATAIATAGTSPSALMHVVVQWRAVHFGEEIRGQDGSGQPDGCPLPTEAEHLGCVLIHDREFV
jgi:hypothetical protein